VAEDRESGATAAGPRARSVTGSAARSARTDTVPPAHRCAGL